MTVFINCRVCDKEVEVPNFRTKMCPDCSKSVQLQRARDYKARNKESVLQYTRDWKAERKEHISEYNTRYSLENREAVQARQTIQHREKRQTDPVRKAYHNITCKFSKFHRGQYDAFSNVVLLELPEFREWIESQFSEGMDWSNHGPVWHIDHVVPCRWFDFNNPDHASVCFHWGNMRPLGAFDNLKRKGCSLQDLLNQEIKAYKFNSKLSHFKPLVTKFVEKSSDGRS